MSLFYMVVFWYMVSFTIIRTSFGLYTVTKSTDHSKAFGGVIGLGLYAFTCAYFFYTTYQVLP